MSLLMSLKIFSDLCFLFAIWGAFPDVIPYHSTLLIPAVLCAIGAGFATALGDAGRPRLRRLGAAFPAIALYLAHTGGEFWMVFPAAAYTLFVILRGNLHLEYYTYRHFFRQSLLIVAAVYLVLAVFGYLESLTPAEIRVIHAEATLRYGLIHLFTGIVLQRQLRLGAESKSNGNKLQMAAVMFGTGGTVLAFVAALPSLRKGTVAVIHWVMSAIVGIVLYLYEVLLELLEKAEVYVMLETVEQIKVDRGNPSIGAAAQQVYQQTTQAVEEERSAWWIIFVAAVLAFALSLLLKTFRKQVPSVHGVDSEHRVETPQQIKKESRRTNRGKVRHCYREYLRYVSKGGLILKKHYTSKDILLKSSDNMDKAAVSSLREVYLLARYQENCEITQEQVEQAKEALKRIRSGVNIV